MLSDKSIREALEGVIKEIREGRLESAVGALDVLDFGRLQKPIRDDTRGSPIRFRDPAELSGLGVERVNETGNHILECRKALSGNDRSAALDSAARALERWREA